MRILKWILNLDSFFSPKLTWFLGWPVLAFDANILERLARVVEKHSDGLGTAGQVKIVELVLDHVFWLQFS
jgi:hypothetical protein